MFCQSFTKDYRFVHYHFLQRILRVWDSQQRSVEPVLRQTKAIHFPLKMQSYNLRNKKYMLASTQISNTATLAFIAVLPLRLLSCKVFFIKRKQKLLKSNLLFKKIANFTNKLLQNYKQQISRINYCKIINSWDATFSGSF